MHWSEVRHLPGSNGGVLLGGSSGGPSSSTPQIKNHSVTHHRGYLYCFGGYDGRRNHQTLFIYSLKEQRWITPSLSPNGDGTGSGHDNNNNNNNNFDHGSVNISISNSNSNSNSPPTLHQFYTVRGVPPPGRNGHTATLATITRRRQLRRQQQLVLQLQQHPDAAMLLDHSSHPRTVALREEDNANDIIFGESLMGTTLTDPSRKTTQQQHHYHSNANGLEDLIIIDNAVNAVDNVMNDDISNLCHEESGEKLDESAKHDATDYNLKNTKVLEGLHRHHHQMKQQEQMLNPCKDKVTPVECLDEKENDTCNVIANNNINPMENDEDDGEHYNENNDEYDAQIIIIGGWLGAGPFAASDVWVLDISGGLDRLQWFQPPTLGTPPGPCNMHSADFIPSRGEIYVFRGGNGREYLNDLHALDVETYIWRKVQTHGTPPQQRANHSSALIEDKSIRRTTPTPGAATSINVSNTSGGGRSQLFIFGGWNGSERLNDIHILDTDTNTWSTPRILGIKPHPRAGMTLTALRGRIYLFGGSGTSSKCFDDLHVFDRTEMAWLDVNDRSETYRGGMHHSSYACSSGRRQPTSYGHSSPYSDNGWNMVSDSGECDTGGNGDGKDSLKNGKHRSWSSSSSTWDLLGGQDGMTTGREASGIEFPEWRPYAAGSTRSYPLSSSANPNDEEVVPSVHVFGTPPGRRAGHSATAVAGRFIYIFGGSCGNDYLNDFFVLDTDPPPKLRVTESPSPQLYASRLRHFCNDEEFSDVTFLVEGRKVFGHKLVLSTVSDCFRAMFMAGFRESASNKTEIEIPNCSYGSFLTMMKYIYTGQCPQDIDILGSDGLDRAISLLELADQFFLYHLKQSIEVVLQPAVNDETCTFLFQVSQKTNANQLESYCRYYERNMSVTSL